MTDSSEDNRRQKKFYALWFRCTVTGKCRQFGLVDAGKPGGVVTNELRGLPIIELGTIIGELIDHRVRVGGFLEGPEHTWAVQWAEYYTELSRLERHASNIVAAGLMS